MRHLPAMLLTVAVLLPAIAVAAPTRHTDSKAGIAFPMPRAGATAKTAKELAALNAARAARAAGITYTSGYTLSKKRMPYLLVWTTPIGSTLTRATIEGLGDGEMVFRLLGIKNWRFDKTRLRGTGVGERIGAIRSQLAMQVLKHRYVYVGYFYDLDEQLADWQKIKAGITPLAGQRVDYQTLPASGASRLLIALGKGAAVAALLGGLGWLAWRLQRRQRLAAKASAGQSSVQDPPNLAA